MFSVLCDHSVVLDGDFGSFSDAESYAKQIADKAPTICAGSEILAYVRTDAKGSPWVDLTFAGCRYA